MVSIAPETACQDGPLMRRIVEPVRGSLTKVANAAVCAAAGAENKGCSSAGVPTSTVIFPGPAGGNESVLKEKVSFGIPLSSERP